MIKIRPCSESLWTRAHQILLYRGDTCSRIWYQKFVPETCKSFFSTCHAFLCKIFLVPEMCIRFLSVSLSPL